MMHLVWSLHTSQALHGRGNMNQILITTAMIVTERITESISIVDPATTMETVIGDPVALTLVMIQQMTDLNVEEKVDPLESPEFLSLSVFVYFL